jgi:S-(hydroxymethyl)glutathione dehydrogenase / alcohol dehydrogenase
VVQAVIAHEAGRCELATLTLRPIGPRDVMVRIEASGICYSDISVLNGELGRLPVVLGHEGAVTVLAVGADVTAVQPGDRAVLSAIASCGTCWFCARAEPYLCENAGRIAQAPFLENGSPVRGASGLGTFSDELVVDERAVVPVQTDLALEQIALVGCAVLTGAGSVLNIATVEPGDSVLVVGAGGVGLSAVQAARAQGALPIAALDPSAAAREAALASGATHALVPGTEATAELMELTGGRGFDLVVECVGLPPTWEQAWPLTRRGGHIVVVGVGPRGAMMPLPIEQIPHSGRRISGCVYGSSSVHRDIPRYVAMAEAGLFDFGALLGRTIDLAAAPEVLTAGPTGPGRTVIVNH